MMLVEPWSISISWGTGNQPVIINATAGGYPFNASRTDMRRYIRWGNWWRRDYACPHLSGENYAYADGHVKWVKAGSTTSFWAREPRTQGPDDVGAAWAWVGPNNNYVYYWFHPGLSQ